MTHKHILWQQRVHTIEKSILQRSATLPEANLWIRRFNGRHWLSAPLLGVENFAPTVQLAGYSADHELLVVDMWDANQQHYATFVPHSDGKLYFSGHTNNLAYNEAFHALLPTVMMHTTVAWTNGEQLVQAPTLEALHAAVVQLMQSKQGLEAWCSELGWFKAKSTNAISFNFKQQAPAASEELLVSTIDPIEAKLQQLYANARATINHMHANFEQDYPAYVSKRDKLLVELKELLTNNCNY